MRSVERLGLTRSVRNRRRSRLGQAAAGDHHEGGTGEQQERRNGGRPADATGTGPRQWLTGRVEGVVASPAWPGSPGVVVVVGAGQSGRAGRTSVSVAVVALVSTQPGGKAVANRPPGTARDRPADPLANPNGLVVPASPHE